MALAPKFRNWLRTLGAPEDPVATDTTSAWSAMSLLKAIYAAAADGSIGAAITGRAEGFVALCQGAVMQCAGYVRLARVSGVAAAASASAANASASNASTDAATASGYATVARDAADLIAGMSMLGQRAKKDRVAAAASAAAAAASAASVPTAEQAVLAIQIYS